jgi:hypothetical protein
LNHFPISVSQIAEGMTNASSTLAAAGNTFEQSVALLTAANTTMQNAAKASTGLRTIAARIRNTKTDLEELGEDMTDAKYEEVVQKLTDFGVALKDVNGNYRSTYDIMADIAKKWDSLSSMQQSALATELSGTRQQAVFYSIINQFKEASGAMDQMSNSAGELEKSYSIYMDSAQAKINQFKAGFQELSTSIFSSKTLGNIVGIGSSILNIANAMAKANTLLPSIIASIGAIKAYKLRSTFESFASLATGSKIGLILTAISGIMSLINTFKDMGEFFGWWEPDEAEEVKRSASDIEAELKQLNDTAATTAKNFRDLKSESDQIIPRFVELSSGVDKFGKNVSLTDSEYEEYISLSNKLAEMFPSINMGMDINGNAMLNLGSNADTLTESLNALVEAQRKVANQEISNKLPDAIKDINELNEQVDKVHNARIVSRQKIQKEVYEMGVKYKSGSLGYSPVSWITSDQFGSESERESAAYEAILKAAQIGVKGNIEKHKNSEGDYWFSIKWNYDSFDPEKAKQVYEDGLKQNQRVVEDINERIKERWKSINPMLSAWMETDSTYNTLSDKMQDIAKSVVSGLNFEELGITTESGIKDYITNNIIAPLNNSGDDVKDAFENITNWQEQLKNGEITSEEFATKVKGAFDQLKNGMSPDAISAFITGLKNAGFEGETFDEIVGKIAESWSKVNERGVAALTDISDSLSALKTKYDIITKAQDEMFDGSVTADTIKALKDAIGEAKDVSYLDFLYEENGAVKLNIKAWKEYSDREIVSNKQSIEDTIGALQDEREELEERKKALYGSNESAHQWLSDLDNIDEALRENSDEIEANQNKLKLYETLYDNAALNLDAYSVALDNFKNVAEKINNVSDSLTTVADIQERVRNGFTLSLEEAVKFAEVYPEILNNASATADGQIRLNSSVVNSFISGKELELKADLNTKINELTAEREKVASQKAFAETQLRIIKQVGEGEGKISKETAEYRINIMNILRDKLAKAYNDETLANKLACEAMDGNWFELDKQIAAVANDSSRNMANAAYDIAENMANNLVKTRSELQATAQQAFNLIQVLLGNTPVADLIGKIGGGVITRGASITLSSGSYNGTKYTKDNPASIALKDFVSGLETEIKNYDRAMQQIDGQIATLRALRNTSLEKMSTAYKDALKKASNGQSESKSKSSGSTSDDDNWFIRQYKMHNHLLNMDAEAVKDYLDWLDWAYKQAYKEQIITLDDYRKYCEEVYKKLQELFKDYIGDVEHEISMRSAYDSENKKIVSLYKQLIADVEKETKAARAEGLTDTDEYIQYLQKQWRSYTDALKELQDKVTDNAKDSIDKLVDIRIKMIKQDLADQRDAIKERLAMLKEFYDKQKQMLNEQAEEDKYLEEQAQKRKAVVDIQDKLNALELDNSASAMKKKLELRQDLADAQKELDDFETERARKNAEDTLDKMYEQQEKELNAQEELLEQKENDAKALYEQALADIKNGSISLYNEMIQWNDRYGDGIKDTIKNAWEEAYKALEDYKNLFDKTFNGVNLQNATGYIPSQEGWDNSAVAKKGGSSPTNPATTRNTRASSSSSSGSSNNSGNSSASKSTTSTAKSTSASTTVKLDDATKRAVAAAIWNGAMGWGAGADRTKKLTEVFGANNGIQVLVNQGVGSNVVANAAYSYLNMRKKFKGYASGTSNASSGLHSIDELGTETVFQSKNGNKYMMFTGGEKVLSAKASDFLYNFANKGADIISRLFGLGRGFSKLATTGNIQINAGDIIVNGNADRATVSEIRRAQRENLETILKEFKKLNK